MDPTFFRDRGGGTHGLSACRKRRSVMAITAQATFSDCDHSANVGRVLNFSPLRMRWDDQPCITAQGGKAMKRCPQCHGKLGLDERFHESGVHGTGYV